MAPGFSTRAATDLPWAPLGRRLLDPSPLGRGPGSRWLLDVMGSLIEAAEVYQGAAHSQAAARCCWQAQLLSVQLRQPAQAALLQGGEREGALRAAAAMEAYEDARTILLAKGEPGRKHVGLQYQQQTPPLTQQT